MAFSTECPQGELQPLPTSLENSSRSAGRSGPDYCQVMTFSLGATACEVACTLFPESYRASLQSQMLLELIFPVRDPWGCRTWHRAQNSHYCGRTSAVWLLKNVWVIHHSQGYGLDCMTEPLLDGSLWFLLYVFSCRSFRVVSSHFHWWLFRRCHFALFVKGGELLRSFYSAILARSLGWYDFIFLYLLGFVFC